MSVDQAERDRRALVAGRRKARHYAMQALYEWTVSGNSPAAIERHFREDFDLKGIDDAYFRELLHEVPARAAELDECFAPLLQDRAIDELGHVERALLRIGSYELAQRIDVPYRVVIDEAVALAKKFGATDSYKFINGVLDRLARELRRAEAASPVGRRGGDGAL